MTRRPAWTAMRDRNHAWPGSASTRAAALEPELKQLLRANPNLALSLQADETVPYKAVARTMAAISRSGVSKLSVLTAPGG